MARYMLITHAQCTSNAHILSSCRAHSSCPQSTIVAKSDCLQFAEKFRDQIKGAEGSQHFKMSRDSGIAMRLLLDQDRYQCWLHSSLDIKEVEKAVASFSRRTLATVPKIVE